MESKSEPTSAIKPSASQRRQDGSYSSTSTSTSRNRSRAQVSDDSDPNQKKQEIFSIKGDDYHSSIPDDDIPDPRRWSSSTNATVRFKLDNGQAASTTPQSTKKSLAPSRPLSTPPILSPSTNGFNRIELFPPAFLPQGSRSLSGISLRAHLLGIVSGLSLLCTLFPDILLPTDSLSQIPFYLFALSTFHFLEFYVTASYNPPQADVSAFLLSANGAPYIVAHVSAVIECITSRAFPDSYSLHIYSPTCSSRAQIIGIVLMLIGQTIRFIAMKHAGTSFNHIVQTSKQRGHLLVTTGIYAWLRHPAYFGFYWWALGTQLWMGNRACLVGFTVLLWAFFKDRIVTEERGLVEFFGNDYVGYRNKTAVGIPFIS